jgi:hypothetical protein
VVGSAPYPDLYGLTEEEIRMVTGGTDETAASHNTE